MRKSALFYPQCPTPPPVELHFGCLTTLVWYGELEGSSRQFARNSDRSGRMS
jgi:hypothetical protein